MLIGVFPACPFQIASVLSMPYGHFLTSSDLLCLYSFFTWELDLLILFLQTPTSRLESDKAIAGQLGSKARSGPTVFMEVVLDVSSV